MNPLTIIKNLSAVSAILLSVTLFALANLIVKSLDNISTIQIVYFRSLFILLATHAILKQKKIKIFNHPHQGKLWLRGLAGTLGLIGLFWTIKHIPLASAVTLHYLSPLFTVVLASIFLKDRVKGLHYLALFISFIGVALIKEFDPNITTFQVVIACLSALSAAVAYTTIRSLKDKADPLLIVYYFPLVTIPLCTIPLINYWVTPTLIELIALVVIGFLTFLAQLLLTQAYTVGTAKEIAPYNYLGIFYAMIFGQFLFDEILNYKILFGIFLVLFGVWWSRKLNRSENGK